MEECGQEVYSPQGGSFACTEKETRRKRIRRTRILEESCALFNICRKFLQENEAGWKTRSTDKMKRIREEEKKERLRRVAEKQKKFGN